MYCVSGTFSGRILLCRVNLKLLLYLYFELIPSRPNPISSSQCSAGSEIVLSVIL